MAIRTGICGGTWYTLKLVINTDTDKFDLYVNEGQKITQAALRNAVDDISKIEFHAADENTGNTYVDIETEPASASNAALSGLVISQGTLSPAFAPGTTTIRATSVSDSNIFGQCTVTVLPADVPSGGDNGGGRGNSGGSSGTETPKTPEIPKTPETPGTLDTTPAPETAVNLTDTRGHWAEADINKLVALGAVKGYPDGSFKPDKKITRAEFITILVNALKLSAKAGKSFADTSEHWAKDYISTASAYEITAGYDDGTFRPNDSITRELMLVMVVKAAKFTQENAEAVFTDISDISPWASAAINTAKKNEIIGGYPDNSFRPSDSAAGAEAVTVIVKTLERVK